MKKVIASVLTLAVLSTTAFTCFAADPNAYDQTATEANTSIQCSIRNDPTYTVTIPASVSMDKNGTDVAIEASDVQDLDNQKISITIEGTDYFRNQMVLVDPETRDVLRYQIITPDGEVLETTGTADQMNGKEILSFTEDGTKSYTLKPVMAFNVVPGDYAGTLTYGISVVDAE